MVRKAVVDKNTWEEFNAPVTSPIGTWSCCGLCGNHGTLRMHGLRTPAGYPVPPVMGYCICPNGRAEKFIDEQLKKKAKAP